MKKAIYSFSFSACLSMLLLASCNSKDYNTETAETTAPVTIPDTTQQMTATPAAPMTADTGTAKALTTTKTRKVKVTTVMMTGNKAQPMNSDKQGYYSNVEILPMYPGGKAALDEFISNNIEYPETANDNGVEGVVNVSFAVDETGKVSSPKILGKPLGYGLEEEVIKAINKMPTWTPGIIKGKNVKTYYTLPVNFKLDQ